MGHALLVTTLTIHLGEVLMRPVGPQFVGLVNLRISATPRELTQRAMN